jgi:hypothetical protein
MFKELYSLSVDYCIIILLHLVNKQYIIKNKLFILHFYGNNVTHLGSGKGRAWGFTLPGGSELWQNPT